MDDDGDLVVPRKKKRSRLIDDDADDDGNNNAHVEYNLSYYKTTSIDLVGLQIWAGSLLLSDFLLSGCLSSVLPSSVIIELGAGIGLCSLSAMTAGAKKVVASDAEERVLKLLEANIAANNNHINNKHTSSVTTQNLDWYERNEEQLVRFWEEHVGKDEKAVIIAADVVYGNDSTKALLEYLVLLFRLKLCEHVYMALEKRVCFSAEKLAITSPCYDYFLELLNNEMFSEEIQSDEIETNFPSPLCGYYDRTEYLKLWHLTCKKTRG